MHLASLSSQEENDRLEKHVNDFGKLDFWLIISAIDYGFNFASSYLKCDEMFDVMFLKMILSLRNNIKKWMTNRAINE